MERVTMLEQGTGVGGEHVNAKALTKIMERLTSVLEEGGSGAMGSLGDADTAAGWKAEVEELRKQWQEVSDNVLISDAARMRGRYETDFEEGLWTLG